VVLSLTVEEGIKLIISGGSVMTSEQAQPLREAAAALHATRAAGAESP